MTRRSSTKSKPVLSIYGTLTLKKSREAKDHDQALPQLMERVAMQMENAKFGLRTWIQIDWSTMHWTRLGSAGGERVTDISKAMREAIHAILIARGCNVASTVDPDKKINQTYVSWGN